MEAKKKFKLKINVLDVIIIALVIVAGFVLLKLGNADGGGAAVLSSGTPVTVRYNLELSNLTPGTGSLIKPGDSLMEVTEKRSIGKVISVEIEPYRVTSKDMYTGNFILTEVPDRETAQVVVELAANDTGSEIDASGFVLRAGENLPVTGPGYSGAGLVTSIER